MLIGLIVVLNFSIVKLFSKVVMCYLFLKQGSCSKTVKEYNIMFLLLNASPFVVEKVLFLHCYNDKKQWHLPAFIHCFNFTFISYINILMKFLSYFGCLHKKSLHQLYWKYALITARLMQYKSKQENAAMCARISTRRLLPFLKLPGVPWLQ